MRLSARGGGTSIFDPVLCELMYYWFNVPGGAILDPFAGGSVRGIVASKLDMPYCGIELSDAQVKANIEQAKTICEGAVQPNWVQGDSAKLLPGLAGTFDMIFGCPPYADLEVYSNDPADLSNMPYEAFLGAYSDIIAKACAKLADNRFAVFVVGEVRAKKGHYYNLVGDTITAFKAAGLHYYNELILVNAVGTLRLRAGKQFNAGRKIGKQHQNVLVFYKGDPKQIKAEFGEVEMPDLSAEATENVLADT